MKPLENMLAILGICAALLGPFAASGEEAMPGLDWPGFDACIEASGSDRAGLPDPLRLEPAPLRAESELDEDLGQDPASLTVHADAPTVESNAPSWEERTSSQDVTLGARSARGPPAA